MNYFSQALSTLSRMPGYTALSLIGLVISLSGTVIIARYLHQEWTVDSWIPDLDRTYLMMRRFTDANADSEGIYTFIGNPNNEKGYVNPMEEQSAVESWTNISLKWPTRVTLPDGESFFSRAVAVDGSLTKVFPYRTAAGTLVMHAEEECIVSEEFARRYFPDEDAVGQTLVLEGDKPHTIVGVFRQPDVKTSFRFDVAQYRDKPWHVSKAIRLGVVRLREGYTAEAFNAQQPEITFTYEFEPKPFRYCLTPYLPFMKEHFANYRISDGPCLVHQSLPKYLWMLLAVGVLLFFVGVFNFLNLYAVMRHTRNHEMKVRRIFGASKWNLFAMLYAENLLISAPAMLGVWMIIELTTPHMKDWFAIEQMTMPLFDTVLSLSIMFILPLIATAPSLRRRAGDGAVGAGGSAAFLFLQYFISLTLITVSLYLMRQLHLMMDSDPGYRTEGLLSCRIFQEEDYLRSFKSDEEWEDYHKKRDSEANRIMKGLKDCPYIRDMCEDPYMTSMGSSIETADGVALEHKDMNETLRRMYGLEVLEGRMFCDSLDDFQTHYHCLLNETALKRLGLKDWHGAKIQLTGRLWFGVGVEEGYNPPYEVVGILRDFHSGRLSEPRRPGFFSYEGDVMGMDDFVRYHIPERVVLDVEPGAEQKVINYLRKLKQEVLGTDDLLYEWVTDQKAKLYEEDRRTARIFFTFSLLAIGVTCLGVLGLMMFDVRRRYREIALRKVHGARFRDIALLLSRRYIIILGLAAAVSIPVSLIGLHKLITRYYTIHASIAWWIPLLSLLIVLLLAALTLWHQIWRATRIEPSVVMKVEQ
ncbi:MAG: ABC transporter permease [Bacteroidaceae bacterium]|nr:ABC transporter permease [Bacteroidaceae bacterium]